eukprot:350593-Chlamydomonas_euryale.AAC.4
MPPRGQPPSLASPICPLVGNPPPLRPRYAPSWATPLPCFPASCMWPPQLPDLSRLWQESGRTPASASPGLSSLSRSKQPVITMSTKTGSHAHCPPPPWRGLLAWSGAHQQLYPPPLSFVWHAPRAHHEDQEVLFRACRVWEVDHQASAEANLHRRRNHHFCLRSILGVDLQNRTRSTPQRAVQRLKEALRSAAGMWACVGRRCARTSKKQN